VALVLGQRDRLQLTSWAAHIEHGLRPLEARSGAGADEVEGAAVSPFAELVHGAREIKCVRRRANLVADDREWALDLVGGGRDLVREVVAGRSE
jgi:hypothetical protein